MKKHSLFIFITFLLFLKKTNSQNLYGGEINLENISGLTYKAKVSISLISTTSYTTKPYVILSWGDLSPLDTLYYQSTICGINALTHIYSKNHTYPSYGNYTLTCSEGNFITGISNLINSSSKNLELKFELFAQSIINVNTSPTFSNCITNNISINANNYNPNILDLQSDSLSSQLYNPTNYVGFSMPNFTINPSNASLTYTGSSTGMFLVPIITTEYRKIANINYVISKTFRFQNLQVSSLSGLNEITDDNDTYIYPNPFKVKFSLNTEYSESQILKVTNSLGKIVLIQLINNPVTEISLNNFPSGIYFVVLQSENKYKHFKLIKD